jgi:hypothetical protein
MTRKKDVKICERCGKPFQGYTYKQRFCSRECSGAYSSEYKYVNKCRVCGKEFISKRSKTSVCSKQCLYLINSLHKEMKDRMDCLGADLIRWGQQNPYSMSTALWQEYKRDHDVFRLEVEDEHLEED